MVQRIPGDRCSLLSLNDGRTEEKVEQKKNKFYGDECPLATNLYEHFFLFCLLDLAVEHGGLQGPHIEHGDVVVDTPTPGLYVRIRLRVPRQCK